MVTPDNRSPDPQPSASALNVARCRAIAAHEAREEIKGPDFLAEIFLDDNARQSLYNPAIHAAIIQKLHAFSPGAYEYFIARTAYIDAVMEQALHAGIPQIVLLGAGYDTRAYRFRDIIGATHIFELDMQATQQHKRSLLDQAQVTAPPQLTYVTTDFAHDSLPNVLAQAGFDHTQQTLFIWEGVTYYLAPATVTALLQFVKDFSAPGSTVVFDYMLPEADLAQRFGAQQARAAMQAVYTAEPLGFDLAAEHVNSYLGEYGFTVIEHLTTADMQRRYLTLQDGSPAGQALDLFGLILASH